MSEAMDADARDIRGGSAAGGIDWGRAVMAGVVATVLITISMALFGNNIMKSLGSMVLGASAGVGTQYAVGGAIHLVIGIVYGIIYALVFGPLRWSPLLKGLVFGAIITAIALVTMPLLASMMGGSGAANPCNPCAAKTAGAAANPCNPCAAKTGEAVNPCNPCAAKTEGAANPCNPCAAKTAGASNPCAAKAGASNPCAAAANPCNPCGSGGGGGGVMRAAVSLVNHLVYSLALAFLYGRGGSPA